MRRACSKSHAAPPKRRSSSRRSLQRLRWRRSFGSCASTLWDSTAAGGIFDAHMPGPNKLERTRDDVHSTAADLLRVPAGTRSKDGLRHNVRVGIQYIEAWLRGIGCVPLYHLMEDAATAEISRAQMWQWIHHRARLDDTGEIVDATLLDSIIDEEMARITSEIGDARIRGGRFVEACT